MKPDRNYYLGRYLDSGYQVQKFVGAGAFAWVYYAVGQRGEGVAIKIQYNLADDARKRFSREIKVLQQLPGNDYLIKYVADGTTPEGFPYLVMEYVDGATLKESLKYKSQWEEHEACNFMVQLCDAFAGLHELGLAHRDVKPDNIMLTRDWRVKLMDLGLVKDAQGLLKLFETEDILAGKDFNENLDKGVLAGTPEYMAPEQFSDPSLDDETQAQTDTTTDVYSLGLIFYEIAAGRKLFPFNANTKSQSDYARSLLDYLKVRTGQKDDDLAPPASVSQALWTVMQRSLRCDPKVRQRNAAEFAADLRRYLETGQGVTQQDEEKTSAIDLNSFLALHGGALPEPDGRSAGKGPGPKQQKTLPLPPIDAQAVANYNQGQRPGMPQPGMPQPGMPHPGMPQPGMPQPGMPQPGQQNFRAQQPYGGSSATMGMQQYNASVHGPPVTDPRMIAQRGGGSTRTILIVVLVILVLAGVGGVVAFLAFAG